MSRPIQARIDLSALKNNLRVVRRLTSSRVMAVIKANAYGHGLLRIAEALQEADGFAVLDVRDAVHCAKQDSARPSCCWKATSRTKNWR